jgi:hypothetical protein
MKPINYTLASSNRKTLAIYIRNNGVEVPRIDIAKTFFR